VDERITFVGHATLLIETGGARFITDPVLRSRVIHLQRHGRAVAEDVQRDLDGILISHLHRDHWDTPSLRLLERWTPIVVPRGAGALAASAGFTDVREVAVGDAVELSGVMVRAVPAEHDDRRDPVSGVRADPIGYVVEGPTRVYFAGDTDTFAGMRHLAGDGRLDVALLPVWGWGPSLGAGHMDPQRAAESLELLRPRIAMPIHWGTLYPVGLHLRNALPLSEPPARFAALAARLAPDVDVRVLQPGGALVLTPDGVELEG
jgi:L-ascorbate metabolism protein UlaG (beta-lactamase superfamily)